MSSWKLPKSLKQLKDMGSDKDKSRSTTITPQSLSSGPTSGDGTATSNNPGDVAPSSNVNPGVLIVTLYEAKDLTIPAAQRPSSSTGDAPAPGHSRQLSKIFRTYAVLEFDKTQVVVSANSGVIDAPVFAGETTQFKFDVSREAELSVGIYMRNPGPRNGNEDIFLGSCKVTPSFEKPKQSQPRGGEWQQFTSGGGSVKIGLEYSRKNEEMNLQMSDFELITVVGKGSFGKVMQVKKRDTQRIYALKTIRKQHIISRSEVSHTMAERTVLAQINNPFIVPLKFSFQSKEKLYLVLAFVNGGELFHHLQRESTFEVNRARFYTAELLCALECLHGFNVIYRDLKPENILLDYTGHIALCDFGLCKLNMKEDDKTNTFCGTPEYLAPELLLDQGYTKTVDWWTLGVLLYEMLTGLPPFYDENTNEMYKKILHDPLQLPNDMDPDAKSLLIGLLDRDPSKRLGANGAAEIKSHKFFKSIDWQKLLQKKIQPTFRPNVMDAMDTRNFDPEFTQEVPTDSLVEGAVISNSVQGLFEGWSYNRPAQLNSEAPGSIRDTSRLK